jgi:transcriptional regulator with XRE-family HTH domain
MIKRHAEHKAERYAGVATTLGWTTNAAAARALGISESTVSRTLSGKQDVNLQFLLALLDVAEDITSFRRMFKIAKTVSDEEEVNPE